MNLDKIILLVLLFTQLVFAEGIPFQVSSKDLNTQQTATTQNTEEVDLESQTINDLKYLAVSNWLQSFLGPKFSQFDKFVTPEFAEKYILDYKVSHSNQPRIIELIGHLDGDSLKKWIRLVDSKAKGANQIKPLWIVSSNLPGFNLLPSEMGNKIKESSTLQLLAHLTQTPFQKLNAKIVPLETAINLETPPKSKSSIQDLTSWASRQGDSLIIWETFTTCPGCTNPRFDIFVYNTNTESLAFVVGDDINISMRDFGNTESLKRHLLPIFQQFQSSLENSFSEGSIHDKTFTIIFENIDSYRSLKLAESVLNVNNGITSSVFNKAKDKTAEYEIRTSQSAEEVAQKLEGSSLGALKLQVSRKSSSTLGVKIIK